MAELRVGVVGTGFLAETRARCWAATRDARVAGVASREPGQARAWAQAHAVARAFDDAHALIASDGIDLVDLCVPNRLHRPLTEAAAAAGKHVLCTKPLTAYVGQDGVAPDEVAGRDRDRMLAVAEADARAMVEAAERADVRLFYGENWLHAPAIVRAGELLERAGASLLEMRGWECHSGSHSAYARSWHATGGGALLRLGAHPIGAMLALKRAEGLRRSGEPVRPVAVTADVATPCEAAGDGPLAVAGDWGEVESWGCAILHFEDGARGVAIGSDGVLGGMESRLELYGSNCHLKCNLSPHDQLRAYAPEPGVLGDAYLMEKLETGAGWSTPLPDEDASSGQQPMCQAIADAIAGGGPCPGDGELGLDVVRVVYAAYLSAAEGRRVDLA